MNKQNKPHSFAIFCANLQKLRNAKNLTLDNLAAQVDVKSTKDLKSLSKRISLIENGLKPSLDDVDILCKALDGVDVHKMLYTEITIEVKF